MSPIIVTTAYLTEQLRPWLEFFSEGTARWGLVTDVRADGTTFKRHGVVVELVVESPNELIDEEQARRTHNDRGEQLREAIDLVKLVLAVEPMALKSLLLHEGAQYDEEELAHLFHGKTPTELRVVFEFRSETKTGELKQRFVTYFLEKLHSRSHWASDELRRRMIQLAHHNLRDVPGFKASSFRRLRLVPVPVTLSMDQFGPPMSYAFFEGLTTLATALQSYHQHQQDTPWAMSDLHAPLAVRQFDLFLNELLITRGVTHAAEAFLAAGIRVNCTDISVDVRSITCGETDLTAFLQAVTCHSSSVYIEMGRFVLLDLLEENDHEWRDPILSAFTSIAAIDKPVTINLTGMLLIHDEIMHRNAIFQGLFEAMATRSSSTSLTIGCSLKHEDVNTIFQCQRQWHLLYPGKQIRVTALDMLLEKNDSPAHALLAVLDDVEDLAIRNYSQTYDSILSTLRFPSLRRLKIHHLSIPSMDMFDSNTEDPRFPKKSSLESLEINGLQLDDRDSLRSFIERLDPSANSPSSLAKSLQTLTITQYAKVWVPVKGSLPGPCNRFLAHYYDDVAVAALHETCQSNRTLQSAYFVGYRERRSPLPDSQTASQVKTGHHVPASMKVRHSQVARARNASFLSVVRETGRACKSAIGRIDARTVQLILDLSAPHVNCTLHVFV